MKSHSAKALVIAAVMTSACVAGDGNDDPIILDSLVAQGVAPPAHGLQLLSGPIAIPPGTEVQRCFYFKNPSREDVDITRYEILFPTGSHHTTLFQTKKQYPDGEQDCFVMPQIASPQFPDGLEIVIGSNSGPLDYTLPPGVSIPLRAGVQLVLLAHYVNASTQKTTDPNARVTYNLHTARDRGTIKHHAHVFQGQDTTMVLQPRESGTFTTDCPIDKDINILSSSGHFHSRGNTFKVWVGDKMGTFDKEIYYTNNWNESPFVTYQTPIKIPAGGGFRMECSYTNPTDQVIKFGHRVETDEHCILAMLAYPLNETARCLSNDRLN
jgi:hypothetical protein